MNNLKFTRKSRRLTQKRISAFTSYVNINVYKKRKELRLL